MTPLRERFIEDLRIRNLSPKTIKAYVAGVVRFARHFHRSPAELGREDIRAYQLHLLREHADWSLYNQTVCALKFLYRVTLDRPDIVDIVPYGKKPKKLPTVLDPEEVTRLIAAAKAGRDRTFVQATYACGLRLNETLHLQVGDIDSTRMVIHIRQGKGLKERLVPLSARLLEILRAYWRQQRPAIWLFPGLIPGRPLSDGSVSRWFQAVVKRAGFPKRVTCHTLRHSFATHMLEAGIDLATLQALLGHSHLRATLCYLHISTRHLRRAPSLLELLPLAQPLPPTPPGTAPEGQP